MAGHDLMSLWRSGKASAVALAQAALEAIERSNPSYNAIITVTAEQALEQARAVDARSARGDAPALRGMPMTLKDNIDMAGVRMTVASDFFRDHVAGSDAAVVERLRDAGAVIVGKANLHEFVLGATGQSAHFGPCRNPWDVARVPGGSSSGSGASVAAGMCVASIGSDTGGSIRNPAAFNNVCGLKPTLGRISCHGAFPVSPAHDVLGPLAASVRDTAAVYDAIAGFDARDARSEERAFEPVVPGLRDDLEGMRLGVPRAFYCDDLDDGVATAFADALDVLRERGARIVDIELDEAERAWHLASRVLIMADAAALHRSRMEMESQRMGRDVYARISAGREVSGMDYADALRFKEAWRLRVRGAFTHCDVMLTPTCPFPAPPVDQVGDMGQSSNQINRLNFTWSLAGVPALSIPCGFSGHLPVGFQAVAPWWREADAFRVGAAYQSLTDWHTHSPPAIQ